MRSSSRLAAAITQQHWQAQYQQQQRQPSFRASSPERPLRPASPLLQPVISEGRPHAVSRAAAAAAAMNVGRGAGVSGSSGSGRGLSPAPSLGTLDADTSRAVTPRFSAAVPEAGSDGPLETTGMEDAPPAVFVAAQAAPSAQSSSNHEDVAAAPEAVHPPAPSSIAGEGAGDAEGPITDVISDDAPPSASASASA